MSWAILFASTTWLCIGAVTSLDDGVGVPKLNALAGALADELLCPKPKDVEAALDAPPNGAAFSPRAPPAPKIDPLELAPSCASAPKPTAGLLAKLAKPPPAVDGRGLQLASAAGLDSLVDAGCPKALACPNALG